MILHGRAFECFSYDYFVCVFLVVNQIKIYIIYKKYNICINYITVANFIHIYFVFTLQCQNVQNKFKIFLKTSVIGESFPVWRYTAPLYSSSSYS